MNHLTKDELAKFNELDDDYDKAYYLVSILFKDKKDKEGEPYIGHLTRVASKVNEKNTKVAALLHDSVEDIEGFTFEDLKELGFNDEIIELVRYVTKKDGEAYHDKISSILNSNNDEAIKLKYADMSDNYNEERLSKLDIEIQTKLRNKYQNEYIRLESYLKERNLL